MRNLAKESQMLESDTGGEIERQYKTLALARRSARRKVRNPGLAAAQYRLLELGRGKHGDTRSGQTDLDEFEEQTQQQQRNSGSKRSGNNGRGRDLTHAQAVHLGKMGADARWDSYTYDPETRTGRSSGRNLSHKEAVHLGKMGADARWDSYTYNPETRKGRSSGRNLSHEQAVHLGKMGADARWDSYTYNPETRTGRSR